MNKFSIEDELSWPFVKNIEYHHQQPRASDWETTRYTDLSYIENQFNVTHKMLQYLPRCGTLVNKKGRPYPPSLNFATPGIRWRQKDFEAIGRKVYMEYIIDCISERKGWTREQVIEEAKKVVGWRWGSPLEGYRCHLFQHRHFSLNWYLHVIGEFWAGPSKQRKYLYNLDAEQWQHILHEAAKSAFVWSGFSDEEWEKVHPGNDGWEDVIEPQR